jgi:hypothetical protein
LVSALKRCPSYSDSHIRVSVSDAVTAANAPRNAVIRSWIMRAE